MKEDMENIELCWSVDLMWTDMTMIHTLAVLWTWEEEEEVSKKYLGRGRGSFLISLLCRLNCTARATNLKMAETMLKSFCKKCGNSVAFAWSNSKKNRRSVMVKKSRAQIISLFSLNNLI